VEAHAEIRTPPRALGRGWAARVRPELLLCGAVVLWAAIPLLWTVVQALADDAALTGAYGLVPVDQLQYMTWMRDAGEHVLISNLHQVEPTDSVFLHPVFLVSGLLWKLGLSLQLAYLVWLPVAAFALILGVLSYMRRLVPAGAARWSAIALALFMAPPLVSLTNVVGVTEPGVGDTSTLQLLGFQLNAATALWGYLPKAISIGLMPLVFLACERRQLAAAAAGALVVSWLHPWQGLTLALVLGGLLLWYRLDRAKLPLLAVIAAASAPLLYYFALSETDPSWGLASDFLRSKPSPTMAAVALIGLSPFLLLALRGVRRPRDMQDRILLLWPPAAAAMLLVPSAGWFYAVAGASIPLAVLMVRGWQALGLGRTLAAVLIAAVAIPGAIAQVDEYVTAHPGQDYLYQASAGESAALDFLARTPEDGAVVASPGYGAMVTAFSGRQVWNGHFGWTPGSPEREAFVWEAMTGRMSPERARSGLASTGATFVAADCRFPPAAIERHLGAAVTPVRTFGCAGVYRIAAR
jgi:hypothetical protein